MEKQNFFIGKIGTFHILLNEWYVTLWYNHVFILHVVLCIQTCQVIVTEKWIPNSSECLHKTLPRNEGATSDYIVLKKIIGCQSRTGLINALRCRLTILKVTYIYIYIQNFSPVVKARKSMDNFVEAIYLKEISRKSISYLRSKTWSGLEGNIKK